MYLKTEQYTTFLKKMGQNRPLFVNFCPFLNTMANIVQHLTKKHRWRDRRMVGADESTELERQYAV